MTEKTCIVCGKAFCNSHPQAKTCSPWCSKVLRNTADKERRAILDAMRSTETKPEPERRREQNPACKNRKMEPAPDCQPYEGDCAKCGWNPEVERERIEKLRGE